MSVPSTSKVMSVLPFELGDIFVAFVRVVVEFVPRFGIARRDGRTALARMRPPDELWRLKTATRARLNGLLHETRREINRSPRR